MMGVELGSSTGELVSASKPVMTPCLPIWGRRGRASWSRSSFPSSTHWRTATDVMSSLIEATAQTVD